MCSSDLLIHQPLSFLLMSASPPLEWGMGKEKEEEKRKRRRRGEELTTNGQTILDVVTLRSNEHNKIIQLLVEAGGKCLVVCEGKE